MSFQTFMSQRWIIRIVDLRCFRIQPNFFQLHIKLFLFAGLIQDENKNRIEKLSVGSR